MRQELFTDEHPGIAVPSSVLLGYSRQTRQQNQNTAELRSPHFLVGFDSRSKEIKYCHRQTSLNNQGIYFNLALLPVKLTETDSNIEKKEAQVIKQTLTEISVFSLAQAQLRPNSYFSHFQLSTFFISPMT